MGKAEAVIKSSWGLVHAVFACGDCDWTSKSYKNAQACAANHAKAYGHVVTGEVVIAFTYTGIVRAEDEEQ